MKKRSLIKIFLVSLVMLFGLGLSAQALTDVTPANSVLNPVNQTLYAVDNTGLKINVRRFDVATSAWFNAGISPIALPAKSYGLAVSADGTKLYASINAGASSKVTVYSLDSTGTIVTSSADMAGASWSSYSSPAGLALDGSGRLYLADKGIGRVRIFDTNTNTWIADLTEQLAGKSNLYAVAVTPAVNNTYKIYVSRKTTPGYVYVFDYSAGAITYNKTLDGMTNPTYLKVLNGRLYVAVNGTDGVDIKVYNTEDDSPVGNVMSGISGAYGWTSFDITADGSWLFFKKATDNPETNNKLFKIEVSSIPGPVTEVIAGPAFPDYNVIKSDGLALSFDKKGLALTDSPTGAYAYIDLRASNLRPRGPDIESLVQLNLDGTVIDKGTAAKDDAILVRFPASDPDGDNMIPTVGYRNLNDSNFTTIDGPLTASGTIVEMRIPAAGGLVPGNYEWEVQLTDSMGNTSGWSIYGADLNGIDFIISDKTAPQRVTNFLASDGEDSKSTLTWTNPADSDLKEVIVLRLEGGVDFPANHSDPAATVVYHSVTAAPGASISTVDTGLTNNIYYYYAVFCSDASGNWNDEVFAGENADTARPLTPPDTTGPIARDLLPLNGTTVDHTISIKAIIDDTTRGNSNIAAAEYFIDALGAPGSGTAMAASDGSFASPIEGVTTQWDTTTVVNGNHVIYVRGQDAAGNWGDAASTNIVVDNPAGDITAPASIETLSAAVGDNTGEIKIKWTAVGDDGNVGTATSYIVKYSYAGPINTEALFGAATTYVQSWTPKAAGEIENQVMSGLTPGEKIWVSIKAVDEVPNEGALGNCAETIVRNFVPAPTITKIYPQKGPNDRDHHIVIIGTNLYNDMIAKIGNTELLNVHQDSSTMVQADVPAGLTPGVYEVSITCPGGTYDDAAHTNPYNDFTVILPGTDTDAPATVTDFNAADGQNSQSTLSWTNPSDIDLREIVVLRKEGSYPADHSDASAVAAYRTLIPEPGAAMNQTDINLTNGVTYYYAVFSRDTSDNWNDTVDSTTPDVNADTAAVGGGVVPISNISIVRDADAPGSSVTLTWQTNPVGAAVDIYTKTGAFSGLAADWPNSPEFTNITSGTQTDANQVGQGTVKYYKIVPAGKALENSDLTADVAGKYDIEVSEGSNLIAAPLVPSDRDINKVIGNQLTGGTPIVADKVYYYNASTQGWEQAFLSATGTFSGTLTNIEADKGYFVNITTGHTAKQVTVAGMVFLGDTRAINLYLNSNMVGSVFPLTIALNDSNLETVLTGGTPLNADKAYYWDNSSKDWKQAYLKTDNTWQGTLTNLEQGKGYYINNQALISSPDPDSWSYTKP